MDSKKPVGRPKGKVELLKGEYLTCAGYCAKYGGHIETIRYKARTQEIPFEKQEGAWVISISAAEEYRSSWKQRQLERIEQLRLRRLNA